MSDQVVVKVPDSAGSAGNIRLDSVRIRKLRLADLRDQLEQLLRATGWNGRYPVLVGVWESGVLSSPSIQMWLPHDFEGQPAILGIFEQRIKGNEGKFVGARHAQLSKGVEADLRNGTMMIGAVFQRIGNYGPSSFDCVLRQ